MRKTFRIAAAGAIAALTVSLAACGSSESAAPATPSQAPMSQAPTSAPAAAGNGVTTNADVFGPACGQLPQGDAPGSLNAMGPQPVATAASTNPLLSTLVTAVGKVPGLADTLNQQQAITVFAPYNGAFEAVQKQVGDQAFTSLLANQQQLGGLLSYHVVPKRYDATGLVDAGTVTELAGGTVTIGGTPEAPTVTDGMGNTANILCGNIPTSNATVFVIDKVLMPKS
ncbi:MULTISPECIES: fasciclin domain-containing protein [Pseudonocardia]|uniref:Uncaracterized surface protein containing fasciclin (FAS1) repeats n=1 Tax=Pseudonocardia oroxyli TaxID=366584 RepID=A0A1G7X5S0_PSEOR|nr:MULTISPECIES: fasciclin domain-containing protein [Pseudonocardia]MCF7549405.1 fasciclin domain-containing protein [Pseudonocardia sp. WMMC193]SDG79548.1 Uncaracterized surface protein containing fasciclin (FAS1) repeats [Pseudonocardia oroxyli]